MLVGVLLADHPGRDDIVCCATELATNAIQHTTSGQDGYFAAEVTWVGLTIRVSVADTGADSEPCVPRAAGDEDTEHGLDVLARLSTRCGADGDHRGRVVWAEFVPGSEDAPEAPCPLFPELAFQAKTAELRERYADWHTWFGPWTRQWWAAPRNGPGPAEMITEPTASALASHLDMLQDPEPGRPDPEPGRPDTEPEPRSACRIWRVTAEGRVESRLRGVEVEPAKVRHGLGGARQPVHARVLPFDRDRAAVADAVQHPEHAFPVDVSAPRRDEVPAAAGVAPGEVRAEAAVPPV